MKFACWVVAIFTCPFLERPKTGQVNKTNAYLQLADTRANAATGVDMEYGFRYVGSEDRGFLYNPEVQSTPICCDAKGSATHLHKGTVT